MAMRGIEERRVATPHERRRFARFAGEGLMARIGEHVVTVADVSLGGLRLAPAASLQRGQMTDIELIPADEAALSSAHAVRVCARVLCVEASGARLAFQSVHYSLARLIIRHVRGQRRDTWLRH